MLVVLVVVLVLVCCVLVADGVGVLVEAVAELDVLLPEPW